MPIYDYHCANCGQTTEVIHGIDAPAPRFCPVCGAEGTLRKAFAAPAVLFKGSGWAKKDRSSASRSPSKPSAASSGNESSEAPTKTAGTESKTKEGDGTPASKTSGAGED
jgi:putative FmdB family regulatory protein